MASLKDMRNRIASVKATQKITKAMQMVAAAKLRRLYGDRIVETFDMSAHKTLTIAAAEPVSQLILTLFREGKADVVTLFYSRFKSVVSQTPTARRLIPAEVNAGEVAVDLGGAAYEYEPDEEEILQTLLPRNITIQLLGALLENQAGFYASQMAAMDNATRNAGDMINRLNIIMNRTRQAKITTELIEIISGASAL